MRTNSQTELVVIGGGPGGYAAAFLAADLGMVVTLVDLEDNPGGVCLYRGCIPSKALLHVAKLLNETKEAKGWGLDFPEPNIDLDQLRAWKDKVVQDMTKGTGTLAKHRQIRYVQGRAKFLNGTKIDVELVGGEKETMTFGHAILATGSRPIAIPSLSLDSPLVMDSTGALALEDIPGSLLVIGGGYIGLELGSVYAALGSKVTVVEMTPTLLPGADRDLVRILSKQLAQHISEIWLETKVVEMKEVEGGISVRFEGKDNTDPECVFDRVLVSIGRRPNSENLGLENTRVEIDQRGFVQIDETGRTTEPTIYAIGDVVGGAMLAHKASHEGRVAAEAIAGHKVAFDPQAIPAVVFTDPELAWAGLTETEAKEQGREVEVARFPWGASGRAKTLGRDDGLTKLVLDSKTERILGVGIVGPGAGELIAEGTLAIEMAALASDVKLTIHPHPTLSETVMESAEVFFGQSTHVYRPKRK